MMKNFISTILQYVKIVRPVNVLITGCAVMLGASIAYNDLNILSLSLAIPMIMVLSVVLSVQTHLFILIPFITFFVLGFFYHWMYIALAAMFAAAYGNVINDIVDIESDRISHPDRPLASGRIKKSDATAFAVGLAITSLMCAAFASERARPFVYPSSFYFFGVLAVLALLTLYSKYFKRTPIVGNIIVATLTAYALLYGALPNPQTKILIAPALLAFLLNFCRELVKDVQDAAGDVAAGWRTSAVLSPRVIKILLTSSAIIYLCLLFVPSLALNHFGAIYNVICLTIILPIHIYWIILVMRSGVDKCAGRVGLMLKLEMVAGLVAIGVDKLF